MHTTLFYLHILSAASSALFLHTSPRAKQRGVPPQLETHLLFIRHKFSPQSQPASTMKVPLAFGMPEEVPSHVRTRYYFL